MKEQELNKLLDKAIGTKGNLKVPSFWMRKIFKELIEWCKSYNNSQDYITEKELNNRDYATYIDLSYKQDWIPDLDTIRNNANNALKSIPPEYITEAELEQKKCRIDWYIIVNPRTRYLTFDALEDGTFSFTKTGSGNDIQYSKDNGTTWTTLVSYETINVVAGDKVMWKSTILPKTDYGIGFFSSSGKFNVTGNIMSMLYGDDFEDKVDLTGKNYAFRKLFHNCSGIVDASNLILPATTLAPQCYYSIFSECINLIAAPELPATTLKASCYSDMFMSCGRLKNIVMLATDISASNCLTNWVYNIASTGTFTKAASMTSLPAGDSGIPSGWTVVDYVES